MPWISSPVTLRFTYFYFSAKVFVTDMTGALLHIHLTNLWCQLQLQCSFTGARLALCWQLFTSNTAHILKYNRGNVSRGIPQSMEIKLPTSTGSSKKQENTRKTSTFTLLITSKPLTVWITKNCGEFSKRWEYQTTLPASWEICMQVKKQQLEPDMEQQTGSK